MLNTQSDNHPVPDPPTVEALQIYLTAAMRTRIPDLKALNFEVAALLNISENGAYKKLKGINAFSATELLQLARAFNISLDTFALGGSNKITVEFAPLVTPYLEPLEYLRQMRDNLEMATQIPDLKINYATTELQIFHYCGFPELTAFKIFVLWKQAWEIPDDKPEISPDALLADETFNQLRKRIVQLYNRVDSAEFWSLQILENTLNQIEYYALSKPRPEYYRLLCDQLKQLLARQRLMAEKGRKFALGEQPGPDSGAFELYHNEMIYTGNTYLVDAPMGRTIFSVFNNPNFFRTSDTALCKYTAARFERLTETSQALSVKGEKNRNNFFGNLLKRLQTLEERLK